MTQAPILDQLAILADATRTRVLAVLERQELTVSELCDVLQLPQSTVSRHLKTLGEGGWLVSRREGTSRFYSASPSGIDGADRRLWHLVRAQVEQTAGAAQDDRRLERALARRRTRSEEFFATTAGQWDRVRDELFGESAHLRALAGLLDARWAVGDLGCGTGELAEAVAPFVRRVVAVDASREMLHAARSRLRGLSNVEVRRGALEHLPIEDGELDAALLVLVLHYVAEPARALGEAWRALRPHGRVLVVDMLPHDHDEYRQSMGHVWLGFSEAQVGRLVAAAGFEGLRWHAVPPDARARGPSLFTASVWKRGRPDTGGAAAGRS